jgi:serine/threonine protein kinase
MNQQSDPSTRTAPRASAYPVLEGSFGKYQIVRVLGSGASGTVYLAEDSIFERSVALKVLHPRTNSPQDYRERFIREARSVAKIHHPHIVSVLDVNEIDGRPYIAMEWMLGGSAQQAMDERGRVPWQEATLWLVDACAAVATAHQAGMLHRDIKPGNLLLDGHGRVKLGDFGLVKLISDQDSNITQIGSPMGTPSFMSPEQCRSEILDEGSDIYSLGATYFALLTGKPPFQADTPLGVMFAHCSSEPPVLPADIEAHEALDQIIHRAMQKDPSKRFESVDELADTVGQLLGRPGLLQKGIRRPQRWIWWTSVAVGTLLLLSAITLHGWKEKETADLKHSSATPLSPPSSSTMPADTPVLVNPSSPTAGGLFPNLTTIAKHRGELIDLEFTSTGRYLVAIGTFGALAVWDPDVPEKWMRRMIDESNRSPKLHALALIPKRSVAVVGGEGPELVVWDFDKSKLLQRLPHKHGKVRSIDISPKGDRMMTGGDIGWNMWTITPDLQFEDQGEIEKGMLLVHSTRFSSVQDVIGGVSGNGIISLKSLRYPESDKAIRVQGQVISFAFGKTRCDLAYGLDRRRVYVGTSSNRLKPISLRGLPSNPLSLDYSPVRRQIAIGGDNGLVLIVDLDTEKRHLFNVGEDSRILVLRYSPDGETLAMGLGTGKLLSARLPNHRFDPPTPTRELVLDRLTNQLPTREDMQNSLGRLGTLLTLPAEEQP